MILGRFSLSPRWVLLAGVLVALPICFVPILSPDLPWHLAAARWMVQHHALPRGDFMSWSEAGKPWTDFEWGTELVYYALDKAGGLTALWLFKSLIFVALAGVNLALFALWDLPLEWMALALPPLMLSLLPNLDLRPENLTLLFYSLQLLYLESIRLGKIRLRAPAQAALGFACYCLWANLHAGFLTGLILTALYGAGAFIEAALPRVYDPKAPVALNPLAPYAVFGTASILGTLANPFGFGLYSVTFQHMRQLQLLQRYIAEWQQASLLLIAQWPYWTLLFFSFIVLAVHFARTKRTPYAHLLALIFFGLNSASYARDTAFFCLSAYPFSVLALRDLQPPAWWLRARAGILSLGFLAFSVMMYTLFRMPGEFRTTHSDVHRPREACEYLERQKDALSGLRLYNPWAWGGYVDWKAPDFPVFVDGRYLFHRFLPEISEIQKDPSAWDKFMDDHGISLALVENHKEWYQDPAFKGQQMFRPLDVLYFPEETWALVYWDPKAMIFVRRSKVPEAWLKTHEFRYLYAKDQQYLEWELKEGKVTLSEVEADARRYQELAGDPEIEAGITRWLDRMRAKSAAPRGP